MTVFLSYADLGFLGAGMKYAAECFSKGDMEGEIRLVGFSHFILSIFIIFFSVFFLFLAVNPSLLVKDIGVGYQKDVATKLLLILGIFSPAIVLQRILQMIFGIRVQDYLLQRILIIANLIKLVSVFYFFGSGRYDIVGYFLFTQVISLISYIYGFTVAKRVFGYNFKFLIKCFKFSRTIFKRTKGLAVSGLVVTVSWLAYYESDSFAISKLLGADKVAVYAIGFSILTFFRTLLGVFFSPFSSRFNHFIGVGKVQELQSFYLHVIKIAIPVVVFPIIAVTIFARPIVVSWVGPEYEESIAIVRWLVLCNLLGFISYPAGILIVAHEKLKLIYNLSILTPIVYWIGVVLTIPLLGIEAFAVFKMIVFVITGFFYSIYSFNYLQINPRHFIFKILGPYLPAAVALIIIMLSVNGLFVDGKNRLNLFLNAVLLLFGLGTAMLISIFTVKSLRDYLQSIVKLVFSKAFSR
ncbi:hypothetical protein [Pedobacter sp. JY14-1]|uniref:lipopolysaccharide biosynthesis protein n=1 Tax=Pedobacter sp. JY14-1 TaxID=3034151 RepID=UPI0023E0EAD2|nr:hypothetical protein [Pedobacter sp. JY14-1]